MKYRLKQGQESFQVVDGPYAGKTFDRGKPYTDIPPEEKRRFEKIPVETVKPAPAASAEISEKE